MRKISRELLYIYYTMNLAERDQKIFQMKAELENRKKMLYSKIKELKKKLNGK